MTQGSKHWPWPLRSVDVTRNHSWLTNLRQKIERGKFASIDFVFLLKSTEVTWKRRRPDTSCLIFYWLWQSSPSISSSLQSPLSSSHLLSSLPTIIVLQIKSLKRFKKTTMALLRKHLRPLFGYAHKAVVAILQTKSAKEFSQTPKEFVSLMCQWPFFFCNWILLIWNGFYTWSQYHS